MAEVSLWWKTRGGSQENTRHQYENQFNLILSNKDMLFNDYNGSIWKIFARNREYGKVQNEEVWSWFGVLREILRIGMIIAVSIVRSSTANSKLAHGNLHNWPLR